MERHFKTICLEEQDVLGAEDRWARVLGLLPDPELREALQGVLPKCTGSEQRWSTIRAECQRAKGKKVCLVRFPFMPRPALGGGEQEPPGSGLHKVRLN